MDFALLFEIKILIFMPSSNSKILVFFFGGGIVFFVCLFMLFGFLFLTQSIFREKSSFKISTVYESVLNKELSLFYYRLQKYERKNVLTLFFCNCMMATTLYLHLPFQIPVNFNMILKRRTISDVQIILHDFRF